MKKEIWALIGELMLKYPKEFDAYLKTVIRWTILAASVIWVPIGIIIGLLL